MSENNIAKFMFDSAGIDKYGTYLDLTSKRQKLIATNVANVSTPGYRSQNIDFQGEFNRLTEDKPKLQGSSITHPDHMALGGRRSSAPKVIQEKRSEGLSVNIDKEISGLAQNELTYSIAARLLKNRFEGIKKAITGR